MLRQNLKPVSEVRALSSSSSSWPSCCAWVLSRYHTSATSTLVEATNTKELIELHGLRYIRYRLVVQGRWTP